MKKWLFLFLILCNFTFASPVHDHRIDPVALSELAAALDIPQNTDIVIETQKRWLRSPREERWEMAELSQEQRQFVLNWATEEMRRLPVVFIAVPMKMEGACLKRPNTEDTIVAWLKIGSNPCKALFVSDQPFCGYQFAVVKASLPSSFLFDLVGPGVNPQSHPAAAAITLDTIARWIYQENLMTQ